MSQPVLFYSVCAFAFGLVLRFALGLSFDFPFFPLTIVSSTRDFKSNSLSTGSLLLSAAAARITSAGRFAGRAAAAFSAGGGADGEAPACARTGAAGTGGGDAAATAAGSWGGPAWTGGPAGTAG